MSTYAPGADASLPPLTPVEQANKAAFDEYLLRLAVWLAGAGVDGPPDPNPLVGSWLVEDAPGMIVFTETEFTWYEDRAQLGRNFYAGSYSVARGALANDGYVLSRGPGHDCFSVFQRYTAENIDGVGRAAHYYGLFLVDHLAGPDALLVTNQRTGGRFTATRAG